MPDKNKFDEMRKFIEQVSRITACPDNSNNIMTISAIKKLAMNVLMGAAPVEDDWQDISTAPLDTPVLVTDGKIVYEAKFNGSSWQDPVYCEWYADDRGGELLFWKPLPKPKQRVK